MHTPLVRLYPQLLKTHHCAYWMHSRDSITKNPFVYSIGKFCEKKSTEGLQQPRLCPNISDFVNPLVHYKRSYPTYPVPAISQFSFTNGVNIIQFSYNNYANITHFSSNNDANELLSRK